MRYLKQFSVFIFIFFMPFVNLHANLVYFLNIHKKQCGFIAKSGDNYYAYTSQNALLNLGKFIIRSFDGAAIQTEGALELSYYSDIARIKIKPGEQKNQAFEIGGKVVMNSKVQVYSISIADNVDAQSEVKVNGIGTYSFAINKATDRDSAGTPVFSSDDKVLGVLSQADDKFIIAAHWNDGKVRIERPKNKLVARLDVNIRWISTEKADFTRAALEISDAAKFQTEFLPILNWWCANPYRILSNKIKLPKGLKPWANNHNSKAKICAKLVKKCQQNPAEKKGLMYNLMDGAIERSNTLSKFPKNKMRQMQIPWKTPFLRSRAKIFMKNWQEIDKLMASRIIAMSYIFPHNYNLKPLKKSKNKK